jgi:hypothetical protein
MIFGIIFYADGIGDWSLQSVSVKIRDRGSWRAGGRGEGVKTDLKGKARFANNDFF